MQPTNGAALLLWPSLKQDPVEPAEFTSSAGSTGFLLPGRDRFMCRELLYPQKHTMKDVQICAICLNIDFLLQKTAFCAKFMYYCANKKLQDSVK